MEESRPTTESPALPAPESQWSQGLTIAEGQDISPLRLIFHPSGTVVELDRPEVLVGRHSGVDLRLPLPDVSRRHARFAYEEGVWQVYDLNSLNGVWVNEVSVRKAPLTNGDRVRIGGFTFVVEWSAPVAAPADAEKEAGERLLFNIFQALPQASSSQRKLAG